MRTRAGAGLAVAILAASAMVTACGGNGAKKVDVSLVDYKVLPAVSSVGSGKVEFKIKNNGTFVHEFVVDRAATATDLPLEPSGEVNEDAISGSNHLGEAEDIDPGASKTLTVTLSAGKYVLFCNRVDGSTSHFKSGMHTDFTVTD